MLQILITALVSLVIVWILGPLVIPMLARLKLDHMEQEPAPEPPPEKSRKKKEPPPKPPTPTMGGVMVMLAVAIPTLIFGLDGMEFTLPALVALANAEGLPALPDAAAVDLLARHMVEESRHLTVIDLWIADEERRA